MHGSRRRVTLWIYLTLAAVYLVTFGGHFYSGDGIEMARTAESLVLRGDLSMPRVEGERAWGYPGRGGLYYAPYPLGQSLAEAPFIAAGAAITSPLPVEPRLKDRLRHAATLSSNIFITAAIGPLLFLFARRLGYDETVSAALALMSGLGTMLWVYARQDFADPLTALTLLGSALLLRRYRDSGRRLDIVLSGACLGFSLFTKYQMVIYCPVIWVYLLCVRRDRGEPGPLERFAGAARDTLALALPVVLFGLLDLAVNYWKFAALTATGYEQEASPWAGILHIPAGLYGLLLSPGKSLFLYNPLLVLWPFAACGFHRAHRSESVLTLTAAGVTLIFFAPLYWWHGDWSWGPRYLVPLLPLLVLSLAPMVAAARARLTLRRVLAGLLAASLAVNSLGMSVNFFFYLRALRSMEVVHDDWNFIPGLSPIAFHFHILRSGVSELISGEPIDYVYRAWADGSFVDLTIRLDEFSREGKIPDFFWFKAYDTPVERYGLGAIGLVAVALALAAAARLRRALRAAP